MIERAAVQTRVTERAERLDQLERVGAEGGNVDAGDPAPPEAVTRVPIDDARHRAWPWRAGYG